MVLFKTLAVVNNVDIDDGNKYHTVIIKKDETLRLV